MRWADACAPLVGNDVHGFHHRIIVVQWLAHAHEDNVAEAPVRVARRQSTANVAHLSYNLANAEVPHEAHLASRTEYTTHRTTRLRTEAGGETALITHKHRFNNLPVCELQKILSRQAIAAVDFLLLFGLVDEIAFPLPYICIRPTLNGRQEIEL